MEEGIVNQDHLILLVEVVVNNFFIVPLKMTKKIIWPVLCNRYLVPNQTGREKIKVLVKLFKKIKDTLIITQLNNTIQYSYSFSLPFILSKIEIDPSNLDTEITKFSYGILLISIVALLCLINIFGYMLSYVLIDKIEFANKYPMLKKIINRYKNISLVFVIVEGLLCVICLLLIIFSSLFIIFT